MDTQLKAVRHARGWSQLRVLTQLEALGRQRGVAMPTRTSLKTELSRWENGHVQPHEPYRSLLVELYATSAEELGLPSDGLIHVPAPRTGIGPVELTAESVGFMRTLLGEFTADDNEIGASHLLRLATQHVVRLEPMLLHVRGTLRADGLRLLSEFAELAGWFCQDAGRLDAAQHWTDRALDFAEELGDPARRAYVLMRKSGVAADRGDLARSVSLALASGAAGDDVPSSTRALSLRQQAISLALVGDRKASERTAAQVIDEVRGLTAPTHPYVTPAYIGMEAGVSAFYLGRYDKAAEYLGRAAQQWPDAFARDQGVCLARLAVVEVARGNLDVACSVGRDALSVVRVADSARTRSLLLSLRQRLAPYDRDAFVSEFRQQLAVLR